MRLVLTPLMLLVLCASAALAQPVRICDDSREWPPYSYFSRLEGEADTSRLQGAMIELLDEMFRMIQLDYTISAVPWKRCLHEVANFREGHKYEIAIEGTLSEERLHAYYVTAYVYTTTGGYWYSTKTFPAGPVVNSPADLKQYNLCGIFGHNYAGYGVSPEYIRSRPKDYQAAFTMVSLGRCDLFLSNMPTVLGKVTLGDLVMPDDVVGKKVPGLESGTFHIFVAKSSPRAYELLTKINQALHVLNFHGVTDRIFAKYLPTCGRHC